MSKSGLFLTSSDQSLPFNFLHLIGQISNNISKLTLIQHYTNPSPFPIEAEFCFPLNAEAALEGLLIRSDGKVIEGVTSKKDEANIQYGEAIAQGDRPYLLNYQKGTEDIVILNIGNIESGAEIAIEISFAMNINHTASLSF